MQDLDLLSIREQFNKEQILLCFNGPITRSLIEEIGNALKNYLQANDAEPSAAMDVFGTYIEMTQNIRHYATSKGYSEIEGAATIVVARHESTHYAILAGNIVEREDAQLLSQRVEALAGMNKAELKAAYKQQLRMPRDQDATTGAGLGLLDIARKSSKPLNANLVDTENGKALFSLLAIV
ncbi:biofilm regulation protein kinase SiaB [Nitrincola sp. MINF-07-Sa-05]|uniref:biofilm regulation protein kinase SiaB n=1 Tax=Nitrincola salilacus TaxID=3400273 RepID=UPI003918301D